MKYIMRKSTSKTVFDSCTSEAPKDRIFRNRYRLCCLALSIMGISLLMRAADVQIINRHFYKSQAELRIVRTHPIRSHRGTLFDRHGTVIAGTAEVESLWLDPKEFLTPPIGSFKELSALLRTDPVKLEQLIYQNSDKRFLYLPGFRRQNPSIIENIMRSRLKGLHRRREFKRFYPQSDLFAQILGSTNIEGHGVEGLEMMLDSRLTGSAGYKKVIIDRKGRPVELADTGRTSSPGENIKLSLDSRLQYAIHRGLRKEIEKHGAAAASVVVLEVGSGQVLAMVNWPTYNNNNIDASHPDSRRNRAITDVFEAGSTVKPFTIAAALTSRAITTNSVFDTHPGWISNGKFTTRDYRDLGILDTTSILKKSSNVGISLISRELSKEQLYNMLAAVGFGVKTGSAFPGERSGVLPKIQNWSGTSKQTIAYGYGLSMTTLQLANAYATIANQGVLVQPSFERDRVTSTSRAMPSHVADELLKMLTTTSESGGTATRARIPGWSIAAKTGTARKASSGGYSRRYTSVFAAIVPANNPRYAIAVVVDDPDPSKGGYGGGSVAAPIFRKLIGRMLHLEPSMQIKPQVPTR